MSSVKSIHCLQFEAPSSAIPALGSSSVLLCCITIRFSEALFLLLHDLSSCPSYGWFLFSLSNLSRGTNPSILKVVNYLKKKQTKLCYTQDLSDKCETAQIIFQDTHRVYSCLVSTSFSCVATLSLHVTLHYLSHSSVGVQCTCIQTLYTDSLM